MTVYSRVIAFSSGREAEVEGSVDIMAVDADRGSGKREVSFCSAVRLVASAVDRPFGVVAVGDAGKLCNSAQGHCSILWRNVDN